MVDPIKGKQDKKRGRKSIGTFKFNQNCTVRNEIAKPITEFRPLPTVDAETGEIRPGVEPDGTQTFVKFMWGINYAGLVFPHPKEAGWASRNQSAFWVVPTDVMKYIGDEAKQFSGESLIEYVLQNSPYSLLFYHVSTGVEEDVTLPQAWASLFDDGDWKQAANVPDGKIYSPPLPSPEEHALMQVQLLAKGTDTFEDVTYDDPNKSDGSVHPAVLEFKKSATNFIKYLLWNDEAEPRNLTGEIVDPNEGEVLNVKAEEISRENDDGSTFTGTTHKIGFKGYKKPVDPAEIKREWHPWKTEAVIDGETRPPILKTMTAEEQVGLLIKLYTKEVVDYALSGTPYESLIPDNVRGSFKQMQDGGQDWLKLAYQHVVGGLDQGKQRANQPSGPPPSQQGTKASAPSGENVRNLVQRAKESATPGGMDPEQKSAARSSLDKALGDINEEENDAEEAGSEEPDDQSGDNSFGLSDEEMPF